MSDQADNPSEEPVEPVESLVADTAVLVTPEVIAPALPSNKRWYVVHAYSGMEKAVERNLR